MPTFSHMLEEKYLALQQQLRALGRVVVAFSGGVDSTLLLKVALDTLGAGSVLAVTADAPWHARHELAEAEQLATALGAVYRVLQSDGPLDATFVANPPDRCYHCKLGFFSRIVALAQAEGYAAVLDGSNADDPSDWRPGRRATQELGVLSPLEQAGLTKAEIRTLSQALGLPTWSKPALACLATRIPYHTPITTRALGMIEQAEAVLHALGFTQVRVRHHADLARIELLPEEIDRVLTPALRAEITDRLRALGYRYIALDLQGYRTGSMNG